MDASEDPAGDTADPSEPASLPWVVGPEVRPAGTIALWTPRGIGWLSVLLGFPGATVLAALNWHRMAQTRKAVVHLAAAVVVTWALFLPKVGSLGLLVSLGVSYYLYRAQRSDQSPLIAAGRVGQRNGLAGVVLALGGTILIIGSGALIAVGFSAATAHRGVVLFGTGAGADVCSAAGQATTFGPSDPIFVAAVLRETVQPGSRVVLEIDGPGLTAESALVTAQPPYDCLGGTLSAGSLDPGTYVLRYRYDGQVGTPDLASGTFTILASPGTGTSLPGQTSSPSATLAPSPSPSATGSAGAVTCAAPTVGVFPHQAPEIEAALPASVQGRPLTRWSVRGRCWLDLELGTPGATDTFVSLFKTPSNPDPVDGTKLVYGVAGRSDPSDPPFFVYAAVRPVDDSEVALAMYLFFGGAAFHDPGSAGDLSLYLPKVIAGKQVYVGAPGMVDQDAHQRGRPYLYQNADDMFLVITDDDAWAAEAIGKLP